MSLPNTYTDKNETGCCAVPNVDAWNGKEFEFQDQHFIRMYTRSFMYIPLNMGKVMKKLNEQATNAGICMPPQHAIILSHDMSPWKAEQLYGVASPLDGADNVTLNGTFFTKAFEGPYSDANKWFDTMQLLVKNRGKDVAKVYFFYTTCPKCAKHYGKNYTIAFAEYA